MVTIKNHRQRLAAPIRFFGFNPVIFYLLGLVMIAIGKINRLKITKRIGADVYLSDGLSANVLLADRNLPMQAADDELLDVFVYVDNNGHLAATTTIPFAEVDEIAWLKVVAVNYTGAFFDWGLAKDLLVPYSEQYQELTVGEYQFVKLLLDPQQRIVATTKINRFIEETSGDFQPSQKVSILIADETDIGIKAIINHSYWGMLYRNELFQTVSKGQKLDAYIKHIREDLKIDLSLYQQGNRKEVESLTGKILAQLHANNGWLAVTDKTPPTQIYQMFGVSKKVFKQALSALFKERKILLEATGIRLV